MSKTKELYDIIQSIKNGQITDDLAQIRIVRLLAGSVKIDAILDLMDFASSVCPDERCGELADIIERI